jgi:hypothetical protein
MLYMIHQFIYKETNFLISLKILYRLIKTFLMDEKKYDCEMMLHGKFVRLLYL